MFKVCNNAIINTDNICSIDGPDEFGRFRINMNNGDRYDLKYDENFEEYNISTLIEDFIKNNYESLFVNVFKK